MKVEYGLFWEEELLYTRRVHFTNKKERKRKTQAKRWSIALRETSWLNEIEMDILAAKDVFTRSIRATFWEWSGKSRLIFWRWTPEYRKEARDGTPIWVKGRYPCYTKRQRRPSDLNQTVALKNKVANVMQKRYIKPNYVKVLLVSLLYQRVRMIFEWYMMPHIFYLMIQYGPQTFSYPQ